MDQELANLWAGMDQELPQLRRELEEKTVELLKQSLEFVQKDSELQSTWEELDKARRLVERAEVERNREMVAFQIKKEGLLRDLNQAQAGEVEADKKIVDLKAQVQKEIHLFKRVKYEQGYMDRAQGKPPRYPLEADVVRVDQVESEPLVSDVPPFPTVLGSTAGSPQDPPAVQLSWLLL